MRRGIAVVIAVMIGVGVGCGGGDDSSSDLTKQEFIKQADQVCLGLGQKYSKQLVSYMENNPQATEESGVEEIGIPLLKETLDELQELGVPAEDEDRLNAYYDAMDAAVAELEAEPLAPMRGPDNPFNQAHKLGIAYGFQRCGSI